MACLLKNEPASSSSWWLQPRLGRRHSERESEQGVRALREEGATSRRGDPKPGELPMASVKVR